jgi:hypothetical protein
VPFIDQSHNPINADLRCKILELCTRASRWPKPRCADQACGGWFRAVLCDGIEGSQAEALCRENK